LDKGFVSVVPSQFDMTAHKSLLKFEKL